MACKPFISFYLFVNFWFLYIFTTFIYKISSKKVWQEKIKNYNPDILFNFWTLTLTEKTQMKYYWIDFIDDFLYEKSINQWVTEWTIHSYTTVFNNLCLNKYIDIENFDSYTEINFKRFLWELFLQNKWSTHTYNRYRKNLKCFCDYLVRNNHIKENPLKNIPVRKTWKNLPKTLSSKQIKELIEKIEKTFLGLDFLSFRNKTIMYFYIYTGCRLKELVNLKVTDIDFINWTIRINNWKWNKDRIVPMVYKLSDYIISYLLKAKKSKIRTEILFPTRFCWYLQHRDIYSIVDKIKKWLSFDFTPHMLRHTFATELVRKNVNLYNISKVLWHSNIKTTQIYLWLNTEEIRESLNNVNLYK